MTISDCANHVSGYYAVGSKFFTNKAEALAEASRTAAWPQWHYFDDVWKQQNWTSPAHTNIYALYQSRARQLREKYDYICLSFSGGSDSTTALHAFLDSHIHIDEIMIRWPIKATANFPVSSVRHPWNYVSEWALTIKPMLDQLQKRVGDRCRITVLDWSDDVDDKYLKDGLVWQNSQDKCNPSVFVKHNNPSMHTQKAIESGRRTCIVFGRDKPQLISVKGNVYCRFLDKSTNGNTFAPWDRYVEYFYYAPDLPEIVPAQCQILFQYLKKNPKLLEFLDPQRPPTENPDLWNQVWHETVRSLIYPKYAEENWFQAKKPTSMFYDEIDQWMYLNPVTAKLVQSWRSQLDERLNTIDDRFIVKSADTAIGFMGFVATAHFVGHIDV